MEHDKIMEKITIHASKEYDIIIENGLLSKAGTEIAKALPGAGRLCVVCDRTVHRLYGSEDSPLQASLAAGGFELCTCVLQGGETGKNITSVSMITDFLAANHFTRSDAVIALGGGITGDLAGFAASIYMRGIRFIQIPTTLLAMADSSVGGKTGANTEAGKNIIGTFWQPELVIVDPEVLDTLPKKELLNGLAEIIKSGFIGDETIFDSISDGLLPAVAKAINVKRLIVEEDERETGRRRLLNFGHTIGHAIEKCSNYKISHGNAVMTGMYLATLAAEAKGWCKMPDRSADSCPCAEPMSRYIKKVIEAFAYPVITKYSADELAAVALNDKKRDGEDIIIIYPVGPGNCQMKALPQKDLASFIDLGLARAKL